MPRNVKIRRFVRVDEEAFAREIKKRPIIYNHNYKGHKRTNLRNLAWKEVSNLMELSVEECKTRWRSLRDSMSKYIKQKDLQTPYVHYDLLKFLIPHLPNQEGVELDEKPNIEIQDNTTHDQYEHNEEEAEVLEEYEFENVLPNISKIESLASTSNAVDPDERFLLSCLPILQRLTNKKNVLAKIKIQTLLYELEYDEKYSG